MNILVLHGFSDLAHARNTSRNHVFCYQRYAPMHDYVYYCAHDPVTPALRSMPFAAVIFDTSFLSQRTMRPRALFERLKERWSWLAQTPAAKIALPQDEYDEYLTLDDWLCDLNVDVVYGAVGHHDLLYPRASRGKQFVDCLTGYIDDAEVETYRRKRRPLALRRLDLGYRGRDLGPQYGRIGQLKTRIDQAFTAAAKRRPIAIDSMTSKDGAILGGAWVDFLCDCRFVPCGPSGVSMSDPRGEVRAAVESYLASHPDAGFEEVERACFPGQDERHLFTTVPPRIFEAAAAGACQIQIEGPHLRMLERNKHYIPLRPDFANIDTVLDRMADLDEAQRIADRCYDRLFSTDEFRYSRFARELIGRTAIIAEARGFGIGPDPSFAKCMDAHRRQFATAKVKAAQREERQRLRQRIVGGVAARFGRPVRDHMPASFVSALRRLLIGRL